MPLIVSISSLKGGVGKTSVTLGLASAALAADLRVLVVDMDPHGDASTGLAVGEGGTDIGTMLARPKKYTLSSEIIPSGWNFIVESIRLEEQLQTQAEDLQEDVLDDEEVDHQDLHDSVEEDSPVEDPSDDEQEVAETEEDLQEVAEQEPDPSLADDEDFETSAESDYSESESDYEDEDDFVEAESYEYVDAQGNTYRADYEQDSQEIMVGCVDVVRGSAASTALERLSLKKALPRLVQLLQGEVDDYDLILIDCPPTLGTLTSMAWAASDRVISIAEPSLFSVAGTERTLRALARFEANSEYSVDSASVVVNRMRQENPEHSYRLEEMKTLFGELVADPTLPEFQSFQRIQGSAYPVHFWPEAQAQKFAGDLTQLLKGLLQ